jgi:cell division transport system ATP-binding protein
LIEFRDVAVCYAPEDRYPVAALENVTLRIERGEWVFLVGPSGAGKSSLLKLIYGAAPATSGEILVEDRDVAKLGPKEIPLLRRRIGVIFQDFLLMPQKTVWENVAFALQVIGAPQKSLVREVPRALETVGLQNKADARPPQLSGGEQQRVAIARAIVNRPALLLADEPTGNLDPQTGADIIAVLQKINSEGTTIVMATHDRAVVDSLRRRVVRLAEGRVVSDEAHGVYHLEDGVLQQPHSNFATPPGATSQAAIAPTAEEAFEPAPPRPRRETLRVTAPAVVAPSVVAPSVVAPAVLAPSPAPRQAEEEAPASASAVTLAPAASETAAPSAPPAPEAPSTLRPVRPPLSGRAAASSADNTSDPAFARGRVSGAPLGSPENPLVLYDRAQQQARRSDRPSE